MMYNFLRPVNAAYSLLRSASGSMPYKQEEDASAASSKPIEMQSFNGPAPPVHAVAGARFGFVQGGSSFSRDDDIESLESMESTQSIAKPLNPARVPTVIHHIDVKSDSDSTSSIAVPMPSNDTRFAPRPFSTNPIPPTNFNPNPNYSDNNTHSADKIGNGKHANTDDSFSSLASTLTSSPRYSVHGGSSLNPNVAAFVPGAGTTPPFATPMSQRSSMYDHEAQMLAFHHAAPDFARRSQDDMPCNDHAHLFTNDVMIRDVDRYNVSDEQKYFRSLWESGLFESVAFDCEYFCQRSANPQKQRWWQDTKEEVMNLPIVSFGFCLSERHQCSLGFRRRVVFHFHLRLKDETLATHWQTAEWFKSIGNDLSRNLDSGVSMTEITQYLDFLKADSYSAEYIHRAPVWVTWEGAADLPRLAWALCGPKPFTNAKQGVDSFIEFLDRTFPRRQDLKFRILAENNGKHLKLVNLAGKLGVPNSHSHHSGHDALMTIQCWERSCQQKGLDWRALLADNCTNGLVPNLVPQNSSTVIYQQYEQKIFHWNYLVDAGEAVFFERPPSKMYLHDINIFEGFRKDHYTPGLNEQPGKMYYGHCYY